MPNITLTPITARVVALSLAVSKAFIALGRPNLSPNLAIEVEATINSLIREIERAVATPGAAEDLNALQKNAKEALKTLDREEYDLMYLCREPIYPVGRGKAMDEHQQQHGLPKRGDEAWSLFVPAAICIRDFAHEHALDNEEDVEAAIAAGHARPLTPEEVEAAGSAIDDVRDRKSVEVEMLRHLLGGLGGGANNNLN